MYLEGVRVTRISQHWGLKDHQSVLYLIGDVNKRGVRGMSRGIQAIDPNGSVAWSFFPMKSCSDQGFSLSSVNRAIKTGKPYRNLIWRHCT